MSYLNFESIFSQLPGVLFWKDNRGIYRGVNQDTLNTFGFTKDDIIGKPDSDFSHFWDTDLAVKQDKHSLEGNTQFNIDILNINGKKMIQLAKKGPWVDENRNIIGVIGMGFHFKKENYSNLISSLMTGIDFYNFSTKNSTTKSFNYDTIYFTKREAQVISKLLRGETASRTSQSLHLSRRTIEHHIESIKSKLACHTKSEIVSKAFDLGFIELMFMNI